MAGYKKNLALVKNHLKRDEKILFSVDGAFVKKDWTRNGVMIVTPERVVFFSKKLVGYDLESFPMGKITSIELSKNLMGHIITFHATGNIVTLKWVQNGQIKEFVDCVNELSNQSVSTSNADADIPDQIRKLKELNNEGLLTDEEFNTKKSELLAKI